MKKSLIAVAVLIAALVALAFIAPAFINWNDYKPEIAAQARAATGRELNIDGDISLRLLPMPIITVEALRFANLPGAVTPDMAVVESLEVQVALGPLVSGEIEIRSVTLVEPVISLEVLPDGRRNWDFDTAESARTESGAAGGGSDGASSGPAVWFNRIGIDNGAVVYRDAVTGQVFHTAGLDLAFSSASPNGPFDVEGSFVLREIPVSFEISAGALVSGRAIPLTLDLDIGEDQAEVEFWGAASSPDADARLTGKLTLSASDLATAWAALAPALDAGGAALPLHEQFSLTAEIDGSAREVAFNDLVIAVGEAHGSGALSVAVDEKLLVDATLAFKRIDLDSWLSAAKGAQESGNGDANEKAKSTDGSAVAPAVFSPPDDIVASVDLSVEALTYNGGVVSQLQAEAAMLDGAVQLRRLSALFPGGSDMALTGRLIAKDNQPQFDGKLEVAADNLRAALGWLRVDIETIPADRLRKFVLTSTIRLSPQLAQIYGIDLRLDSSRLSGGAAYAFRQRPSFSVDATIDRFNADAYRKPRARAEAAVGSASGETATATSEPVPLDLAVFETFDTDLKVRIGSLTLNGIKVEEAKLDLLLLGGKLKLRELSAGNVTGASIKLAGDVEGFAEQLRFAGDFDVRAEDARGLLRIADVPVPGARVGPVRVQGSATGGLDTLRMDTVVTSASSEIKLAGTVAMAGPVDLAVAARSPNLAELLAALAPDLAVGGLQQSFAIEGRAKGDMQRLEVALAGELGGAELDVSGTVNPLAGPVYSLAVEASHAQLDKFLTMMGVAYRPAAVNLGGLSLKANVAGEPGLVRLDPLEGQVGPVQVRGSLALATGGAVPSVSANLQTSEIFLDLFMPRPAQRSGTTGGSTASGSSGSTQGATGSAGRWSADPIDFGFLTALEGDVQVAARGLIIGAYSFDEPSITLALKNGVLDVKPLKGKLFGGTADLVAQIESAAAPRLAINVTLQGADLGEALRTAAGIDEVRGTLGFSGQFSSAGQSQRELIANLNGQGRIQAGQGSVQGLDLKSLSDRLKRLNEIPDYLGLLATSLSGGATRFSSIGGSFQVANGVARSDDLNAEFEAATGRAVAAVDLPRWYIDLKARFRLTEHPGVPPFGIDLAGPLDRPQRTIQSQELEAYFAQRVGGAIIKKALGDDNPLSKILGGLSGGSGQQGGQSQQQQQQQQQIDPAELILKGIFGSQ